MKPPSLEASAAPEPAEPPEPASSSHVVGPKVHQTPFQLLEGLLPSPDFSILLDENAWRFKVECKVKGQVFEAPAKSLPYYSSHVPMRLLCGQWCALRHV